MLCLVKGKLAFSSINQSPYYSSQNLSVASLNEILTTCSCASVGFTNVVFSKREASGSGIKQVYYKVMC